MNLLVDVLLLIMSYIIGAFPTGLIVGKNIYGIDLREHGSKNIGATNALRVLGWKAGLGVFLIDVGKAAGAILVVDLFTPERITFLVLCGIAVLLGNFFNVFLGFKGGKGVAASLGVFLALAPKAVLIALAVFIVVLAVSRYVSLGSLTAAIAMPFLVYGFHGEGALLYMMIFVAALVIYKHRTNIVRLMQGTETKMGKKKVRDQGAGGQG